MKKKEDLEKLRKDYESVKEQEEMSHTFRPNLVRKDPLKESMTFNKNIAERNKEWIENKNRKIE